MSNPIRARLLAFTIRLWRTDSGAAAVETAIVLPMFLWLIMGIIEMGIVFHIASLSNYAANEAARLGQTGSTYGSASREQLIYDAMNKYLGPWIHDPSDVSLSAQSYGNFNDFSAAGVPGAGQSGSIVVYTVTYNWKIFTPIFAQIISGDGMFHITSRVIVKNEDYD